MTNPAGLKNLALPKYLLPASVLVLALVSPVVGAIVGIFALKQISDRQKSVSNKRLARVSIVLLAAFAVVYIAVAVTLSVTGIDLYP